MGVKERPNQVWELVQLALPLLDIYSDLELVTSAAKVQDAQAQGKQTRPRIFLKACRRRAALGQGALKPQSRAPEARECDSKLDTQVRDDAKGELATAAGPKLEGFDRQKSQDTAPFSTLTPSLRPPPAVGKAKRDQRCTAHTMSDTDQQQQVPHHGTYLSMTSSGREALFATDSTTSRPVKRAMCAYGQGQGVEVTGSSWQAPQPSQPEAAPDRPLGPQVHLHPAGSLSAGEEVARPCPGKVPAQALHAGYGGDAGVAAANNAPELPGCEGMQSLCAGWAVERACGAHSQYASDQSAANVVGDPGTVQPGALGRKPLQASRLSEMLMAAVQYGGEPLAKELLMQLTVAAAAGKLRLAQGGEFLDSASLAATLQVLMSLIGADLAALGGHGVLPLHGTEDEGQAAAAAAAAAGCASPWMLAGGGKVACAHSQNHVALRVAAPVHIVMHRGA